MVTSIILLLLAGSIGGAVYLLHDRMSFYSKGLDLRFKRPEITALWNLAKLCELKSPLILYYSLSTLDDCISRYIAMKKAEGNIQDKDVQAFLTTLYNYRTRVEIEHSLKSGIESTKYLDTGQKLRIIYPGKGVFFSSIVNNGRDMTISLPFQNAQVALHAQDWVDKTISVYLWRKKDAGYVFDTKVKAAGLFMGHTCLTLEHTNTLLRTQKRRSVRTDCRLPASLYPVTNADSSFDKVETSLGLKCVLEDISEDGALVRVGGVGKKGAKIKIQFKIDGNLVIMYGVVRGVDYSKSINQSRLHFECVHIDKSMKNMVLAFVYKVLPEEQKLSLAAMMLAKEDAQEESEEERLARQELMPLEDDTPVPIPEDSNPGNIQDKPLAQSADSDVENISEPTPPEKDLLQGSDEDSGNKGSNEVPLTEGEGAAVDGGKDKIDAAVDDVGVNDA